MNKPEDQPQETAYERPLECGECHRPIKVVYTEVVGKNVTSHHMCQDCPVLKRKLQGPTIPANEVENHAQLCCGGCGLSLEDLHRGSHLGCSMCYDVFKEEIIHELAEKQRIPHREPNSGDPLHIGRIAGSTPEASASLKLSELQQALHDTIGREDYERAAYLRDQIKALEEGSSKQGP